MTTLRSQESESGVGVGVGVGVGILGKLGVGVGVGVGPYTFRLRNPDFIPFAQTHNICSPCMKPRAYFGETLSEEAEKVLACLVAKHFLGPEM